MKKQFPLLLALTLGAGLAHGSIIQSISGPNVATATGGLGNVLIDTSNDAGDWITNLNASGGTVFLGFDWTIDNNAGETGTGGFFGGLGVFGPAGTSEERLLAGNGWQSLAYGAGVSSTFEPTSGQIAYSVGTAVRLVVELTVSTSGADTFRMWVNPGPGDQGTPYAERTDWGLDAIESITHRAGNDAAQTTMENFVVATTFAEAVPEASEALVVLLGMTGLLGFRGRRR